MGRARMLIPFALFMLCSCSPRVSTFNLVDCVGSWAAKHKCTQVQQPRSGGFVDVQVNTRTGVVAVHNHGGELNDTKRLLSGCKVLDEQNWECIDDNHQEGINSDVSTEGMDDGIYYFSNIAIAGQWQRYRSSEPINPITQALNSLWFTGH